MRVVYVHGIGVKPPQSTLTRQWDNALFGRPVEFSRMAYWANPSTVAIDEDRSIAPFEATGMRELAAIRWTSPDKWWSGIAEAIGLHRLELWAAKRLTRRHLPDVYRYLFTIQRLGLRSVIERELIRAAEKPGDGIVVIAHSLGSVIAYEALSRWEVPVDLFLTIGSPLGMHIIQRSLGGIAMPDCVARWTNIADRLDPVAGVDHDLSDDVEGVVNRSHAGLNPDSPGHPHSAIGYLTSHHVQDELAPLGIYAGGTSVGD